MTEPLPEPLEAIIDRFHAPSQPRAGDRSGRTWWVCPFHPDRNPSLCVEPGASRFHCFGCGAHGDAIDFVRRLNPAMTFREAKAAIFGDSAPGRARCPPQPAAPPTPPKRPEGWAEFASRIVDQAEAALWSIGASEARAYLRGRGLADGTIRAARLGLREVDTYVDGIFPDRPVWVPAGITIPWFEGDEVTMVNIRRPDGDVPKYCAIRGSRRGGIYPSKDVIVVGRPLAVVEGVFEALLLGQELAGLAPAITLGGAGDRPGPALLNAMLGACPWYAAGDGDGAGEASAGDWIARSARCRRIRPPSPYKDWTEAHQGGMDLRRLWEDVLSGNGPPPTFALGERDDGDGDLGPETDPPPSPRPGSDPRTAGGRPTDLSHHLHWRVSTPRGQGMILQVFGATARIGVSLDETGLFEFFRPEEITLLRPGLYLD